MERRIKLKTLNNHITCQICRGYLIDATTVTECLHTFCKSCLVKHLEENNTCPTCQIVIHQSHPLQYISYDRTMQDIVYKLVPDLQQKEMKREREFYRLRGETCPKDFPPTACEAEEEKVPADPHEEDYHRYDEQVNVFLDTKPGTTLKALNRKYLRLSANTTITTLKKYVAKQVLPSCYEYRNIDILCNNELLGKDHTLKFVYVTRWRFRDGPIKLDYRPKLDL
ncbi:polycomb group RING finger protein 3 isoform X2 [Bacillus rossius redtenbacheri]